jgi:enoyl-CoA hydratase/carnithine racemase
MGKKIKNIHLKFENQVAFLTFNRPIQLNAMNRQMMEEIIEGIAIINLDENVNVAVIGGEGRAFMAGADIKEYGSQTPEEFKSFQQLGKRLYESIVNSGKPWIAAVQGFALGGGFEIVLSCDLILASDLAVMGLPEVFLSLIPGGGGTQRLIQKVGINRVKEMLFTGDQYNAKTLYEWGIVNRIFEAESFDAEVSKYAQKLARRPSKSIAQLKRLANLSLTETPFEDRINDEGDKVYEMFFDKDAQMAIQNFIAKNKKE